MGIGTLLPMVEPGFADLACMLALPHCCLEQIMSLEIRPLTPHFGAEIVGVDVTELTDESFKVLFDAFTQWSVIFLRDQPALSEAQHMAFARRFGEIHVHPSARGHEAEFPGLCQA